LNTNYLSYIKKSKISSAQHWHWFSCLITFRLLWILWQLSQAIFLSCSVKFLDSIWLLYVNYHNTKGWYNFQYKMMTYVAVSFRHTIHIRWAAEANFHERQKISQTITIQRLHLLHSVHSVHAAFNLFQISRFCDYVSNQIMNFVGYVLFTDLVATKNDT